MIWVALKCGVLPLRPNADRCTLEVVGKTGILAIAKEMNNMSINHLGGGIRRTNEIKRIRRANKMKPEGVVVQKIKIKKVYLHVLEEHDIIETDIDIEEVSNSEGKNEEEVRMIHECSKL